MERRILGLIAGLALATGTAAADSYTLDPSHTYPSWEVWHLGISKFRGKFTRSEGKVTLDPANNTGHILVTIDPASVASGHQKLDEHLKTEDFFHVQRHPEIRFESTALRFTSGVLTGVDGNLTMLGVTRPVTLKVQSFRCTQHFRLKKEVCGAEATTTIKRSDFGMTYALPLVGDEVTLNIEVEGFKD
jgi:polyisoprenoid-binding protein YceI